MFDFTRFNDLAKRKGITKLYIATQIGRHQSIFNDWSKGKSVPKPEHLRQVATLLDTTPEYLTGESDDPGHAPEPPEKQKSCSPKRTACPTPSSKRRWSISSF